MTIKLEVGRTYKSRSGTFHKIITDNKFTNNSYCRFLSEEGFSWSHSGKYYPPDELHPLDLVEELYSIDDNEVLDKLYIDDIPTNSSIPLPEDWIKELFTRFYIIYDYTWSRKHRSELVWKITLLEWQEGLSGITGEQIKIALKKCRNGDFGRFPPNIVDFRAACLGTYIRDSEIMS